MIEKIGCFLDLKSSGKTFFTNIFLVYLSLESAFADVIPAAKRVLTPLYVDVSLYFGPHLSIDIGI